MTKLVKKETLKLIKTLEAQNKILQRRVNKYKDFNIDASAMSYVALATIANNNGHISILKSNLNL